jgi:hypothetical protein
MTAAAEETSRWLRDQWQGSSGLEAFRRAIQRRESDLDPLELLHILASSDADERYIAQMVIRILGGKADALYDQYNCVHYRVRLPGSHEPQLISVAQTAEAQQTSERVAIQKSAGIADTKSDISSVSLMIDVIRRIRRVTETSDPVPDESLGWGFLDHLLGYHDPNSNPVRERPKTLIS